MGNTVTSHSSNTATGKVILPNGAVHAFDEPLTAAELMLEYPQQVVVEFQPNMTQRRPIPLPADRKLDVKKVYLMLPMKRGRAASLSSEEARHVVLSANSVLRTRSSTRLLLPVLARIFTAGTGEGQKIMMQEKEWEDEEEEKKAKKKKREEGFEVSEILMEEMLGSRPEFLGRQVSGKGWKPSLDTINERKMEKKKKVSHWLF